MKHIGRIGIAFLFMAASLLGQEEIIPVQRTPSLVIGMKYQAWRLEFQNYPISQISGPLLFILPLSDRFHFQVLHTPAVTWWEEDRSITGPSDTWIQGSYVLGKDLGLINVGVGLPTGKTRLQNNQFFVSQFLGRNVFRFGLPIYGQGLTIKAGGILTHKLSKQVVFGVGGQYLKKQPYYPVEYEIEYAIGTQTLSHLYAPKYQAGDEATGQLGVDVLLNKDTKLFFDLMLTHYFRDKLDGEEFFGSGQRISLKTGVYHRYEDKYLWGQILYRYKGKNEILQDLTFQPEPFQMTNYQIEAHFLAHFTSVENAKLYTLADVRIYGKNDAGNFGANIFGGGIGIQFKTAIGSLIDFNIKYFGGSYNERVVEGLELGLDLGFEF